MVYKLIRKAIFWGVSFLTHLLQYPNFQNSPSYRTGQKLNHACIFENLKNIQSVQNCNFPSKKRQKKRRP